MPPPHTADRTRTASRRAPCLEPLEPREVPAAVGALDPSFGVGGLVLTGAPNNFNAVAVQSDGKVVAAGTSGVDVGVYRFLPDGSPDVGFGAGGRVVIDVDGAGNADAGRAVAIDALGRIVVVGTGGVGVADFALVRLSPDGNTVEINKSFAVGTAVSEATALAFQSDGTIVLAGYGTFGGTQDFAVLRVDTAGNALGPVTTVDFAGGADQARGVAVVRDGAGGIDKIVVAGTAGGAASVAVARLSAAGVFEAKTTVAVGTSNHGRAVAMTAGGEILVAGDAASGGNTDVALVRLNNDATLTLDTTFNPTGLTPGTSRLDLGGQDVANAVAVQPDGRLVLAGTRTLATIDPVVARTNADGTLNTTFNAPTGSRVVTGVSTAAGSAVALTPTGRIVVAGSGNGLAVGVLARVIGSVEEGERLAVGGSPDQYGLVYRPDVSTGQYALMPSTGLIIPTAAFPAAAGNVRMAVGDVNGDRVPDVALVTGPGVPTRFAVLSGVDNATPLIPSMAPFAGSEDFAGGGFVAVGDLDNDGRAEVVVTPDQGGGPRVTVFSLRTDSTVAVRANYLGIDDPNFRGGARAAVGDVNGDGVQDLAVAAGFLGGPRVALFDGKTVFATPTRLIGDFFAFPGEDATRLRNGAYVAAGDVTGDGFADLVFGGGPGGAPRVFILSGALVSTGDVAGAQAAPVANFFVAGDATGRDGVRVATTDADRDGRAEVVTGSTAPTASGVTVRAYLGKTFTSPAEPAAAQSFDPFDATVFTPYDFADGVFVG